MSALDGSQERSPEQGGLFEWSVRDVSLHEERLRLKRDSGLPDKDAEAAKAQAMLLHDEGLEWGAVVSKDMVTERDRARVAAEISELYHGLETLPGVVVGGAFNPAQEEIARQMAEFQEGLEGFLQEMGEAETDERVAAFQAELEAYLKAAATEGQL